VVISGGIDIGEQVRGASDGIKTHLKSIFNEFLKNNQFMQSVPGHVDDGPVTMQRVQTVIERIEKIAEE
jgi:hypothetical protein